MRSGEPDRSGAGPQSGFAYLLLLLAVALIGLVASAAVSLGATLARRDAERQLLAIGAEFQQALHSYAGVPVAPGLSAPAIPLRASRGPRTLEELTRDSRSPGIRRHLRQVYADPLTGKREWGLVTDAQGFIIGLYSLAKGRPIKQAGFEPQWAEFEAAGEYRQWVFGLPGAQLAK